MLGRLTVGCITIKFHYALGYRAWKSLINTRLAHQHTSQRPQAVICNGRHLNVSAARLLLRNLGPICAVEVPDRPSPGGSDSGQIATLNHHLSPAFAHFLYCPWLSWLSRPLDAEPSQLPLAASPYQHPLSLSLWYLNPVCSHSESRRAVHYLLQNTRCNKKAEYVAKKGSQISARLSCQGGAASTICLLFRPLPCLTHLSSAFTEHRFFKRPHKLSAAASLRHSASGQTTQLLPVLSVVQLGDWL